MKSGVYIIINLIDGKYYVGQSLDVYNRLRQHKQDLSQGMHDNPYLQNSFTKHGSSNFSFELLEDYSEEFLLSMEHYWCNLLNSHDRSYGYNIRPTHPHGKCHHSAETVEKITTKMRNKTKEHISKIQESKWKSGSIDKMSLKVRQLKNGEIIAEFRSLREAERLTGVHRASISRVCLGKESHAKGFKWEYIK